MTRTALAASIAAALLSYSLPADAQQARGGVFTDTANPETAIPDNGYDGTLGSMACSTIDASSIGAGSTVDAVDIEAGIDHTWAGDLTIKLESPDGSVLGVMSRPGAAEATDDGVDGTFGDSSDLLASSPVAFLDGAVDSAESMGSGLGASADVICQDDSVCDFSPAPDSVATPPSNFAGFLGENASGDWTLCVGDSNGFDTGSLESWTINVTYSGAAAPTLGLSTTAMVWGNVNIGDSGGVQTVTVENTGTGSLDIGTLGVSGANAGDFVMSNDSCSSASLAAAATCTFDVDFLPSAPGAASAQMNIPSNAPSSPDTIGLSGNGTVTAVSVPTHTAWGAGILAGLLALFGWLGIRSRG